MPELRVPADIEGLPLVASVSGGKDSTALCLALREAGIEHRRVFADTGWEAPETYEYLDVLRERLGPIDVVGVPGGMKARVLHRAGFPSRLQRFCTRELKLEPLRAYHDALEAELGTETVSVLGIRADESAARAKLAELDDEPAGFRSWGGFVWRPLLRWTVAEVLEIHHRHQVPVNPLYQRGHDRVGCYPCINARKDEIRLVAEHAPERIAELRELERAVTEERAKRNADQPGRYEYEEATYFRVSGDPNPSGAWPIDEVVSWSKTTHGGRQFSLLPIMPSGGCMRWGLCEPPSDDGDGDA